MSNISLCKNCGGSNTAGAGACERCGAALRPTGALAQAATPNPAPPTYVPQGYAPDPPPPAAPKRKMSTGLIAAIVIGAVLVAAVPVVGIVAAIAIPSLLAARRAANESSAIGSLRTIGNSEATFYAKNGRFGTMSELVEERALDREWRDGMIRDGYRFATMEVGDETFEFTAEPESPSSGTRSFNITEEMVVRYREGDTAPSREEGRAIGE